jgi:hypothetical protein
MFDDLLCLEWPHMRLPLHSNLAVERLVDLVLTNATVQEVTIDD